MKYGANPDQLDDLARKLDQSSDELAGLLAQGVGSVALASLGTTLASLWRGPRSSDFCSLWQGTHLVRLLSLQSMLEQAATTARENAAEQRIASDVGSPSNDSLPADTEVVGDSDDPGPYVSRPVSGTVDQARVDAARLKIHHLLNPGWSDIKGVSRRDLEAVKTHITSLNSAERVALIESMSDEDLQILRDQINEGSLKGGIVSHQEKAEFWREVVPYLDIDQKQRIFGDQWADTADMGRLTPGSNGMYMNQDHLLGDIMRDIAEGTPIDGRIDADGNQFLDVIPNDEIEIRKLDNGNYIVILPGVTDMTQGATAGFVAGVAAGGVAGPVAGVVGGAAVGASVADMVWDSPSSYGSARDMRYAKDSLRSDSNTAYTGANAYAFAVKEAMQNAGIPQGANVMLVGHSFGSMTATDLAGDSTFNEMAGASGDGYHVNIDTVVAAGAYSPQSVNRVPGDVQLLDVQSTNDRAVGGEHADLARHSDATYEDKRSVTFNGGFNFDGVGHDPNEYAQFLNDAADGSAQPYSNPATGDVPDIGEFSKEAASKYGGASDVVRVNVKDAYSDPTVKNNKTGNV